jgi:HAD superfamily hydrolase (TIGR01509 family)
MIPVFSIKENIDGLKKYVGENSVIFSKKLDDFHKKCYYYRMKRKIIVFDLDGVLFDSVALSEQFLYDRYPGITKEMQLEILCGNFHEELKKITLPKKAQTEEEAEARRVLHTENKSKVPMYNGAKELLGALHSEGYILALNTSAYSKNCLPLLERDGIVSLFDFLGTAELSKSKVDKFKIIEEKYGFDNQHVLFITDTVGDIKEACVANVPTVAVTWGAHGRNYFTREEYKNLIGIVDSFEELKNFIDSN